MELLVILIIIAITTITLAMAGYAIIALILLGAAVMLVISGVIKVFIVPYFESRKANRLNENHVLIYPQKQRVRIDRNQLINGINPYVIDCFYTDKDTGREFCFTTKAFLSDPSDYVSFEPLPVFVDPVDYSNYYVDTSRITEIMQNRKS